MHLRVETSQYMTSESAIPKEPTIVATCAKRVRQFCHVILPPCVHLVGVSIGIHRGVSSK